MTITEKAKQKLDIAGKEVKEAIDSLKKEVEELSQKVKEKLKGAGEEMKETAQELTQEVKAVSEKVSNLVSTKIKSQPLSVKVNRGSSPKIGDYEHPFLELQQATNRLFDDFYRRLDLSQLEKQNLWGLTTDFFGSGWPSVDVSESEHELLITAELPGVNKDNIEISMAENRITIRGEKKKEEEDRGRDYYRLERSYGSFQRSFNLPCEVETDKVDASFKDGVLQIRLPKNVEAQERVKKIKVRSA
ncbi:Molecular chaperone (modular protein) [uncultured Desulfobacterium sp.]|uniref:Molecular chaperone (Modular protein) n=1 Tax=uncultured Desulfobacterium sp. TaxID=201089 RepID=A0A445MV15_9BACT|nr:Molecular chaperone (modular protein) [uncultured Desulfobacterium sp.]